MREFIIQCNGNEERGGEGECTIKRERERERDGGGGQRGEEEEDVFCELNILFLMICLLKS